MTSKCNELTRSGGVFECFYHQLELHTSLETSEGNKKSLRLDKAPRAIHFNFRVLIRIIAESWRICDKSLKLNAFILIPPAAVISSAARLMYAHTKLFAEILFSIPAQKYQKSKQQKCVILRWGSETSTLLAQFTVEADCHLRKNIEGVQRLSAWPWLRFTSTPIQQFAGASHDWNINLSKTRLFAVFVSAKPLKKPFAVKLIIKWLRILRSAAHWLRTAWNNPIKARSRPVISERKEFCHFGSDFFRGVSSKWMEPNQEKFSAFIMVLMTSLRSRSQLQSSPCVAHTKQPVQTNDACNLF